MTDRRDAANRELERLAEEVGRRMEKDRPLMREVWRDLEQRHLGEGNAMDHPEDVFGQVPDPLRAMMEDVVAYATAHYPDGASDVLALGVWPGGARLFQTPSPMVYVVRFLPEELYEDEGDVHVPYHVPVLASVVYPTDTGGDVQPDNPAVGAMAWWDHSMAVFRANGQGGVKVRRFTVQEKEQVGDRIAHMVAPAAFIIENAMRQLKIGLGQRVVADMAQELILRHMGDSGKVH